jgi:hypothetical protein
MERRRFLALALGLALGPVRLARAAPELRSGTFEADVGILWGALNFRVAGTIQETVDRAAGRYEVTIRGQGEDITNEVDSSGILREGRWTPARTHSRFLVHGRESRSDVVYDWSRRTIEYHNRSETFFMRRLRVTDDTVTAPEGMHVDDVISATLNYADGLWPTQPDGTLLTNVVRRHRPAGESPDDVQRRYRAELVPFVLRVATDPTTGRPMALFDLTRFSSWAKESQPARIVFGPHRRPESISSSLMLGTSVAIRLSTVA